MIVEGNHIQVGYDETPSKGVTDADGWHAVDIRFLINSEITGHNQVTMWRATFRLGAVHARHTHDAAEAFFVFKGRGAAGTDDREYLVEAGQMLFVPPGVTHWFRPLDEQVEIVGCYAPGGSLEEAGYHYVGEVTEEFRTVH
jgi:quercetin dioxygenase-like cupin family protein